MNKIKEIVKSWITSYNPTPAEKELALKRYAICDTCEWKQESVVFVEKCGECGCPLGKKIFSPEKGACGVGKWDKVDGI